MLYVMKLLGTLIILPWCYGRVLAMKTHCCSMGHCCCDASCDWVVWNAIHSLTSFLWKNQEFLVDLSNHCIKYFWSIKPNSVVPLEHSSFSQKSSQQTSHSWRMFALSECFLFYIAFNGKIFYAIPNIYLLRTVCPSPCSKMNSN